MRSTRMIEGVTVNKLWKAYNGYTLYTTLGHKQVMLISMKGKVVHKWDMPYPPALYAELLPNGNLLYAGHVEDGPLADFEGAGGVLMEVDWDGKELWRYEDPYLHHSFNRLPNGNTLVIKWAKIPDSISSKVQGGVPDSEKDGVMWGDVFQEIDVDGKVLWEWKSFEHLDPAEDIMCPFCERDQWTNANSCVPLGDGNIVVSFRRTSTICAVERSSGKILWRWGPHEISHQNCVTVLDNGNVFFFDNGFHAEGIHHPFSRAIELDPKDKKMVWAYRDKDNDNISFYSGFMSSCQQLPNGNTLITESNTGRIFEVTEDGDIVWDFLNPICADFPDYGNSNVVTRALRYGPGYTGLKGVKELRLGKIIQTNADIEHNKALQREREKGKTDDSKAEAEKKKSAVQSRLDYLGY